MMGRVWGCWGGVGGRWRGVGGVVRVGAGSLIYRQIKSLHCSGYLLVYIYYQRLIYNIWSFSGLGGLRASSLEAPGLNDTDLNTVPTKHSNPQGPRIAWTY